MSSPGRWSRLLQAAGVATVTLGLLVAIELAAGVFVAERHADGPTPEMPADAVSRTLAWLDINPVPLVRDADFLWRNEPNARKTQAVNPEPWGRADTWSIAVDDASFRGEGRAAADSSRVYRVLCIGDSITFGFNVDQGDTYPVRLQALLAAHYPGRRFEVVNAGVSGWSWLQGLRFLELRGFALDPDAVVMGHGTNDQALPAKVTDDERFHRLEGLVGHALRSAAVRLTQTNSYRLVEHFFPPPPFSPDQDSPACLRQIRRTGGCRRVSLDQIAEAAREVYRLTSARSIALLLGNFDFVGTPAVTGLRRAVESDAIPFLDAVDRVRTVREARAADRAARLGLVAPNAPISPRTVLVRVVTPDRTAHYEVAGSDLFETGFRFDEPLFDDGTHGDEHPEDGVFSLRLTVPPPAASIRYAYRRDGEPELRPVPPFLSTMGDRVIAIAPEGLAPLDVFGKLDLMAERAHPDRDGQQVIAESVAAWLETVPSFRRFIEVEGPAPF